MHQYNQFLCCGLLSLNKSDVLKVADLSNYQKMRCLISLATKHSAFCIQFCDEFQTTVYGLIRRDPEVQNPAYTSRKQKIFHSMTS